MACFDLLCVYCLGNDLSSSGVGGTSLPGDDSSSGGAGHSPTQGLDLKLLLGITVPAFLVLAVVLYLLGRKVSLGRDQREQVQHDTSNAPEDQIQYLDQDQAPWCSVLSMREFCPGCLREFARKHQGKMNSNWSRRRGGLLGGAEERRTHLTRADSRSWTLLSLLNLIHLIRLKGDVVALYEDTRGIHGVVLSSPAVRGTCSFKLV
ncbi:uncharacterized protein LOC112546748 [Pelodiscus sinensis]|uniref:uncharacterized protein LOC112546748 n=1 Tax=Pelodiscus sinensis TaxID=13735 RepID=UPI003F6C5324